MTVALDRLSAVILAAGVSRRFGSRNKLLETIDGEPMALKAIRPFTCLNLREVVVVLGHEANQVAGVLLDLPVHCVTNAEYAEGMGASLAKGVRSMRTDGIDGCFVSLADLPYLSATEVTEVGAAFVQDKRESIIVPRFKGRRGHPVCFPSRCFPSLGKLRGDHGAKAIVDDDPDCVWLDVGFSSCIRDKDT